MRLEDGFSYASFKSVGCNLSVLGLGKWFERGLACFEFSVALALNRFPWILEYRSLSLLLRGTGLKKLPVKNSESADQLYVQGFLRLLETAVWILQFYSQVPLEAWSEEDEKDKEVEEKPF